MILFPSTVTLFFFFQAEDGIRDVAVTGVQTCALPICSRTGKYFQAASPFRPRASNSPARRGPPPACTAPAPRAHSADSIRQPLLEFAPAQIVCFLDLRAPAKTPRKNRTQYSPFRGLPRRDIANRFSPR